MEGGIVLALIVIFFIWLFDGNKKTKKENCKCKREWWIEDPDSERMVTRTKWICSKCGSMTDFERH